ncbi:hypothetical protein PENSPDRAFT_308288 [Peniophora sp. CONT]|nr:hypothetical protein PENSPDRAFT_308288 [Peniophora sp. CONT]
MAAQRAYECSSTLNIYVSLGCIGYPLELVVFCCSSRSCELDVDEDVGGAQKGPAYEHISPSIVRIQLLNAQYLTAIPEHAESAQYVIITRRALRLRGFRHRESSPCNHSCYVVNFDILISSYESGRAFALDETCAARAISVGYPLKGDIFGGCFHCRSIERGYSSVGGSSERVHPRFSIT